MYTFPTLSLIKDKSDLSKDKSKSETNSYHKLTNFGYIRTEDKEVVVKDRIISSPIYDENFDLIRNLHKKDNNLSIFKQWHNV